MRAPLALVLLLCGCGLPGGARPPPPNGGAVKPEPRKPPPATSGTVQITRSDAAGPDGDDGVGAPEVKLRAGGHRLGRASRSRHALRFEPRPGVRLPALERRLGGRSAGATVRPFATEAVGEEQEPVDRAGELVALSLALQLERLGWSVEVTGHELLAEGLRAPAAGGPAAVRFRVTGSVRFATTAREARLRGSVRFELLGRTVSAALETVAAAPADAPLARRRVVAAEAALASFVAGLLAEPELDRKLAALVPAR
jgi:hypothetical protein